MKLAKKTLFIGIVVSLIMMSSAVIVSVARDSSLSDDTLGRVRTADAVGDDIDVKSSYLSGNSAEDLGMDVAMANEAQILIITDGPCTNGAICGITSGVFCPTNQAGCTDGVICMMTTGEDCPDATEAAGCTTGVFCTAAGLCDGGNVNPLMSNPIGYDTWEIYETLFFN